MSSRRRILKLIGGGAVLAAAGAGGVLAVHQPSASARAPWQSAGREAEFRRRFLSYALLAPNPHNRQPWRVRLDGDDALTLFADLDRRLPATDPYDRQITIGCGAFLELLAIAAAEENYSTEIRAFPEGETLATLDSRAVAEVRFRPGGARPDPLFAHVLARRSNSEIFTPQDVPADALAEIIAAGQAHGTAAGGTGNTPLAAQLRDLTFRAHQRETLTPHTHQESVDLMRFGPRAVAANPDGLEMDSFRLSLTHTLGIVTADTLADPASEAFRQGLAMFKARAQSARGFIWLTNANASRTDQINAGRAHLRLHLTATAHGIALHPWSQALQEYAEMAPLYREVHALVGGGKRLQMLARIGYGPKIPPAPRRGLAAHLMD
jgi:hypothetical protein